MAQANTGELRISITDTGSLPVKTSLELVSEANQFHQHYATDEKGRAVAVRLPDGVYRVEVAAAGFAPVSELVDVRSAVPRELRIVLQLAPLQTSVTVTAGDTLVDPHQTGTIDRIGIDSIDTRLAALPGRSLLDLVSTQPGWLLEANGILHPRGSEYQTQYVIDGVPLTENRSPAFLPDFDVENVQSMRVMTASYPAEYGRKLGGVVDIVTRTQSEAGFHGSAGSYGGSMGTLGGSLVGRYRWTGNTLMVSGDAGRTDRFLDPPVLDNHTNHGTTAGLLVQYTRDLTEADRVNVMLRRAAADFLVPNENVQQAAGQRQERQSRETAGHFSYQRVPSASVLADVRGMARQFSAALSSNPRSTPIIASQDRGYRHQYVKSTIAVHAGRHDVKAGIEADFGTLREAFDYAITDPDRFDPDTPAAFRFVGRARDREQSAFVQDLIAAGDLTLSGGLRWDRYRLLVSETAWSPRLGVAYVWPSAGLVVRASYDRIFQTPAVENLLLASSPDVDSLSEQVLRLPVRPSRGNFYEVGVTRSVFGNMRANANVYRRELTNFADDDLLLDTGIGFPIAFQHASIRGFELKLDVPHWGPWSGSLSYSNLKGVGELPVTGGLFLGNEAAVALLDAGGRFRISQDQRHTLGSRWRYQVVPAFWIGIGGSAGSGLPIEFTGTKEEAIALYGVEIVDRIDFDEERVRPSFTVDLSAGVTMKRTAEKTFGLQADVVNIANRTNVIDFAGVFSGTALGSSRRFVVRLRLDF
jgi:Outer membrane cobalamin receptor protein